MSDKNKKDVDVKEAEEKEVKDTNTKNQEDLIEKAVEKIVSALTEAKGTDYTSERDKQEVRSKLFAEGNLKDISYPSDISDLSKDEKIVYFFKSMLYHKADVESANVFRALVEGTDSEGGYLVPEELRAEIFRILPDFAVMRNLARVIPMSTDTLLLTGLSARPSAYWSSEYSSLSTSSAEFDRVTLNPNTLVCLLPVTQQLLADANINLVNFITELFAESIALAEDKAFFTGSGTGEPKGIEAETLTQVDAGNAGDFDDVIQLIHSIPARHRSTPSSAFVANNTTIMNLRKVKDSNGAYIWNPGSPNNGEPSRLYGYPVYEQNNIANGKVFFGDWRMYIIGDRQQVAVSTTTEGGDAWRRHAVEIKAVTRVDGTAVKTGAFAEIANF